MQIETAKKTFTVDMLEREYWWGGCVHDGSRMPFHAATEFYRQVDPNSTTNPANPFFVSSKGRYIWSGDGFDYDIKNGRINLLYTRAKPELYDGFGTLRGAFLAAGKKHFPPSGKSPDEFFFTHPQYNTWIEFIYGQNQTGILEYAKSILDNGLPPGILMIDDKWSKYYGDYEFDKEKFPNPKELIARLHEMGFKVMLWVVPFITSDSEEYRDLRDAGLIVRDREGLPAMRDWWNGYGAILDFTNPKAVAWFDRRLRNLMEKYGVDGFKFDGGDSVFLRDDDKTHTGASALEQSKAFCEYGLNFDFNEFRAGYKLAGQALVYRLCDKFHSWESDNGIGALVPNMLAMGILGYPYTCPDMIGGGSWLDFVGEKLDRLDQELFVRYAGCSALMPMMQFSAAPWRVLDEKHSDICKRMAGLHGSYKELIIKLVRHAKLTGEPIVRNMEYVFPGQGLEEVTDQFMLGDNVLAAPVFTKGTFRRTVRLPAGNWEYNGEIIDGGRNFEIDCPIDQLAVFIRL